MSILTLVIKGNFNGGFLRYDFGGLKFGGAYTWRCLFSEFYGGQYQRIERMIELPYFLVFKDELIPFFYHVRSRIFVLSLNNTPLFSL